MKAKVINKIVREESGMHTYTLVPPLPGDDSRSHERETIDVSHPTFRPYAMESSLKPVMSSFGHRPKSASRTFNPATMKVC
jgi:hypothetical protein